LALRKSAIIEKAQKLVFKGLFRQAIKEWKRLLSETPNDGNILNAIGDLHLKTGDKENATVSFIQSADAFRGAGFELKSIALFKKALKVDPTRVEINEKLASVYAERGLIGNAIDDYLKAAKYYLEQGDFRSSLSTYRKISQLDPNNENIRMEIAEICQKQGLKDEALEEYKKVMAIYVAHNRTADLDGITRRILEIDPDYYKQEESPSEQDSNPGLLPKLETLSDLPLMEAHPPESILPEETVSGFLEPEPLPMAEEFTIYADERSSRIQESKEASLKEDEQIQSLENGLTEADVYLKYGLTEKAIQSFDRLVSAFPLSVEPHLKLKEIYLEQGNLEKAIESCSHLARLYGRRKDLEKKEAILNELMALELRSSEKEASLEPASRAKPEPSEEDTIMAPETEEAYLLENEQNSSENPDSKGQSFPPILSEEADLETNKAEAPEAKAEFSISKSEAFLSSSEEGLEKTIPAIDLGALNGDSLESEHSGSIPVETFLLAGEGSPDEEIPASEKVFEVEQGASWLDPDELNSIAKKDASDDAPSPSDVSEERQTPLPGLERKREEDHSATPSELLQQAPESEEYVNLQDILAEDLEDLEGEIAVEAAHQYAQVDTEEDHEAQEIETQYDLGIAYKEMGMLPKAIMAFEQASKGERRFGDSINMLVACHRELGSLDLAIELLRKGLSHSYCQGAIEIALKYELAQLYDLKGETQEAASLYDEVFRVAPDYREVASKAKRASSSADGALFSPQKNSSRFSNGEKAKRRNRVSYL